MKIGTKSVLFGAHQFLIHPIFVFCAWWKLFGFPYDPRLWITFFTHDLGYLGKPNMDGTEGERHPYFAANLMKYFFGKRWYYFCLSHSRFLAKQHGLKPSKLCFADKLAVAWEPYWLYLPRVILSGEIKEYMQLAKSRTEAGEPKYSTMNCYSDIRREWFTNVQKYLKEWVKKHKDGSDDTWTPDMGKRIAKDNVGTFQ